jgi:hypothetical protein
MSDSRNTVLIGDWETKRIQVLKDILADEFDIRIEAADNADNFDSLQRFPLE